VDVDTVCGQASVSNLSMASSIHSSGTGGTTTSEESDHSIICPEIPPEEEEHEHKNHGCSSTCSGGSSSNERELSNLSLEDEVESSGPTNIDLVVKKLYLGKFLPVHGSPHVFHTFLSFSINCRF